MRRMPCLNVKWRVQGCLLQRLPGRSLAWNHSARAELTAPQVINNITDWLNIVYPPVQIIFHAYRDVTIAGELGLYLVLTGCESGGLILVLYCYIQYDLQKLYNHLILTIIYADFLLHIIITKTLIFCAVLLFFSHLSDLVSPVWLVLTCTGAGTTVIPSLLLLMVTAILAFTKVFWGLHPTMPTSSALDIKHSMKDI